jgi:signal transduction histidine kinase
VQAVATAFNDTAAKLEVLLLAQREFVSDASHQLRSPLAALRLRLENLERDVTPAGRSELANAESEVGRLSRLVDGLLELARADRQPSAPEPLQLGSIVGERVEVWSPLAAEHGVELRFAPVPAQVLGTPGHVEQVLDNLLANALEASDPGTTITLALERDGGFIELHVLDEGPGMSADEREHAFARFWRVGSASGTGLGLAIVRRLAEADGGTAELREAPGGGIDAVVRLVASAQTS